MTVIVESNGISIIAVDPGCGNYRSSKIAANIFGKKAVDVRVPFKIPAECMEDHDIAGSVIFGMVQVEKHAGYHTGNGVKEAAQEGTVLKEKVTEIFIDGKNAMTVLDINQFKRHTGRALHGIFVPAGSTKAAVTAERDEFKVSAVRAVVHRPARRGVTAA